MKAAGVKFSDAESGFSLALFGENYKWTYEPTPGKKNIFVAKPEYQSIKYYTSGSSYKKYSSSSSYQPPRVFGITQSATDEALYPVGRDYRSLSSKINLNTFTKTIIWLIIITATITLILLLFYSKIFKQPIRGP